MNDEQATETDRPPPALPEGDARRVVALLEAAGEAHPDLWKVLMQPDADVVLDELFRDEIHTQRA